ncbi:MAG: DUF2723 domain-containing protein, partial [Albidovulum sp.]|nr:DUF2723 domain-containing protein [Albidovulum sp.]
CRHFGASVVASLVGALLFAASEHFWSQVIIAEVYAMNTFLIFACYALVLGSGRSERPWIPLMLAAAAYGFGLANHWPLVGLATPGLLLAAVPAWRAVARNFPALAGTSVLCAGLPYAWMVWRSQQGPLLTFYGKIDSFREFWYYVSRQGYAGVDQSPSADWTDKVSFMLWLGGEIARQTTYLGFVFAVFGISIIFLRQPRVTALSSPVMLLGLSVFLILLLGFDYEPFRVGLFRPYSLVVYGLVAIWLAVGLHGAVELAQEKLSSNTSGATPYAITAATALAGTCMLAVSLNSGWKINNLSDHDFTKRHADAVYDKLPPNAVFFVYGDATGPFAYYSLVENRRPDVKLYNDQALVLNDRLYSPFTVDVKIRNILEDFVDSSDSPVFFMPEGTLPERGVNTTGFLLESVPNSESSRTGIQVHEASQEFFLYLVDLETDNRWELTRRGELLLQYGRYLGIAYHNRNPALLAALQHLYRPCESSFHCLLGVADALLITKDPEHHALIGGTLDTAESMIDQAMTKNTKSRLHAIRGRLFEELGQPNNARLSYQRAHDIYPHPINEVPLGNAVIVDFNQSGESG